MVVDELAEDPFGSVPEAFDLKQAEAVKFDHDLVKLPQNGRINRVEYVPLSTFDIHFQDHAGLFSVAVASNHLFQCNEIGRSVLRSNAQPEIN